MCPGVQCILIVASSAFGFCGVTQLLNDAAIFSHLLFAKSLLTCHTKPKKLSNCKTEAAQEKNLGFCLISHSRAVSHVKHVRQHSSGISGASLTADGQLGLRLMISVINKNVDCIVNKPNFDRTFQH